MRISPPNSQPLMSRLVISQADSGIINGTVVSCADRDSLDAIELVYSSHCVRQPPSYYRHLVQVYIIKNSPIVLVHVRFLKKQQLSN